MNKKNFLSRGVDFKFTLWQLLDSINLENKVVSKEDVIVMKQNRVHGRRGRAWVHFRGLLLFILYLIIIIFRSWFVG